MKALKESGIQVVVAPGLVVDQATADGLVGILLYSRHTVKEAIEDAVEAARLSRLEFAKRERISTILGKLRDGVLAVGLDERIEIVNPALELLLGQPAENLIGRPASEVSPDLSLVKTLGWQDADMERVQTLNEKTVVVSRLPILEQGKLTGAVLICQDPRVIQRVDRSLRKAFIRQVLAVSSLLLPLTALRFPKACWKASFLAMSRGHLLAPAGGEERLFRSRAHGHHFSG